MHCPLLFRFAVWEVSNALEARPTCYWPKETEKLYTPEGSAKYLKRVFLKAVLWAGEENGAVRSRGGKCRISTPDMFGDAENGRHLLFITFKNGASSFKLPAEISKSCFGSFSPHFYPFAVDGLNMARPNEIMTG